MRILGEVSPGSRLKRELREKAEKAGGAEGAGRAEGAERAGRAGGAGGAGGAEGVEGVREAYPTTAAASALPAPSALSAPSALPAPPAPFNRSPSAPCSEGPPVCFGRTSAGLMFFFRFLPELTDCPPTRAASHGRGPPVDGPVSAAAACEAAWRLRRSPFSRSVAMPPRRKHRGLRGTFRAAP